MRLLLIGLLLVVNSALAVVETYEFSDDTYRERYLHFTQVLRCPKCQNQNLADSNAPIAADLRRELHRLLEEGKSDTDITDFMVLRYGEYVLYDPPLESRTLLLWLGPVVLLMIGVVVVVLIARRGRRPDAAAAADTGLTEQEQARLAQLLRDDGKDA